MAENPGNGKSEFVLATHVVIVDGQEVYKGDDAGKAQQLFLKHMHDPACMHVYHEVRKSIVPFNAYGMPNWSTIEP